MQGHVTKFMVNFNFNKKYLFTILHAHKNIQINQIKSYYLKIKFLGVTLILLHTWKLVRCIKYLLNKMRWHKKLGDTQVK